ncbi:MAG: metal-sensing transcriptional repressor [Bacilli bacterium]|nr:metal-sensing transcriptional repressor [Bacilli bacterium]
MENCPHCKKDPRPEELVSNLQKRLKKISGQINGVSKMVDENRYCGDILIQIAAIESALKEVGYIILKDHMYTCVSSDIKDGNFSSLEEALEISKKLK